MKKELSAVNMAIVIAIAVAFSAVNAFVSMYLGLKTGFSNGIDILLIFISFVIVTAMGIRARSKVLLYMCAIIAGSTGVAVSYIDGLGAIILSGKPFDIPDYAMMGILALGGAIGLLMSYYFSGYFLKSDFPWPGSRAQASLINMLTAGKNDLSQRASAMRLGASAAISAGIAGIRSVGALPDIFGSVNLGISVSPMMAGIGLLIGWRSCLQVAAGALASAIVYFLLESPDTDYSTHMRDPWIFSPAVAMMVTTAVITLYLVAKPALASFRVRRTEKAVPAPDGGVRSNGFTNYRWAALCAAVACAVLMMALFPGVPVWVFLISLSIAVIFMVVETRGRAEMGIGIGMSSFIILLIVGLAFDNIIPLLVLEGFVVSTILTFSLMFSVQKVAEFCGVDRVGLTVMALIGVITGSVLCVPFLRFFSSLYGIGSVSLPAPYSVMWLELADSTVAKVISPSLNPFLILAGVCIAIGLYRYKISPIVVSIGLMLPVSTSAAVTAGGIIAYAIEKKGLLKGDNGITASGLMIGDIVVSILASLVSL